MGKAPHGGHRYRQLWGPGKGVTGRGNSLARARQRAVGTLGWSVASRVSGERADARGWAVGWAGSCRGGWWPPPGGNPALSACGQCPEPLGTWPASPSRPGRASPFCYAGQGSVMLVPWAQTHRDIPTVPEALTPHLTSACHIPLSLSPF